MVLCFTDKTLPEVFFTFYLFQCHMFICIYYNWVRTTTHLSNFPISLMGIKFAII